MNSRPILRCPDVVAIVGFSRSTLYRYIGSEGFPAAVRLGPNCVGWRRDDVDAWLASRPPAAVQREQAPLSAANDGQGSGQPAAKGGHVTVPTAANDGQPVAPMPANGGLNKGRGRARASRAGA